MGTAAGGAGSEDKVLWLRASGHGTASADREEYKKNNTEPERF